MAMDGMAMDGMAMPGMTDSDAGNQPSLSSTSQVAAGHPSIGAMGPCERKSCQPESVVAAKISSSLGQQVQTIAAFTVVPHQIDGLQAAFPKARDDIASFHPDRGNPLSIRLRI